MILIPIFVFGFGLLIGSFLNVVILRMNTGRSTVTGRSKCMNCNRTLEWYELIPVFSYVSLGGKCKTCKTHISYQYPIVELITAIVFTVLYIKILLVGSFSSTAVLAFLYLCTLSAVLIVITIYDLRHKIIPDSMVYTFILMAVASIFWHGGTNPSFSVIHALVNGVLVALPFFLLWFLSKGRLMGFGDVKLMLGIGWLLTFSQSITAILIAFWIGGAFGLILLATSHKHNMKSEVPFAPFLILGLAIAGLWGITLQSLFFLW